MQRDRFIEEFGAAIEARQASVLVGAGLSRPGYPVWLELLRPVAQRYGVAIRDNEPDLPQVAQYIANSGGDGVLIEHIVSAVADVTPVPRETHRLLVQLPVRDIWTTNYDSLIETADASIETIARDADFVARRAGERRLYKMHGSIPFGASEPEGGRHQLVISRDDYDRYEQTHPRFWQFLQGQFLTTSFLFLGFSLTDPNFDNVFRLVRRAIVDEVMPHYAIMRRPSAEDDDGTFDHRAADLKRVGISTVEIADYAEVGELVRRLVARTLPARLLVSGSYRAESDPEAAAPSDPYPTAPASPEVAEIAQRLGLRLAAAVIPGVVAAGDVGATLGYAFLDGLAKYEPERFTLVRRQRSSDVTPPMRRRGQIYFAGEEPRELRGEVFTKVRAVVVLGGTHGTRDEIGRARDAGMSVVPVARSGGAALAAWQEMSANLTAHQIGQRPIDPDRFAQLNATEIDVAVEAAAHLIAIALFAVPADAGVVED